MTRYLDTRSISHDVWQKLRMRCLVRDSFTCQESGCGEQRLVLLEVHHRQPGTGEPIHDLDSLITLCRTHYYQRHAVLAHVLGEAARATDDHTS